MNIVYHSSDMFAPVVGVSMTSLFENNKTVDSIHVYIIENGIQRRNKEWLQRIADDYGRDISFITMPDVNERFQLGLVKVKERWIFDSYCRLFLSELLPNDVNRVLYLDSDILVTDSLEELWEVDLHGKSIGAVSDGMSKSYYHIFGLRQESNYCQGGVILFDLQSFASNNYTQRIREYIRENGGYVFYMEQSVLNSVFQDEISLLHPRYNVTTLMQVLSYKEFIRFRQSVRFYSEKEVEEALKKPAIVHMTSCFLVKNRAWYNNNTHPMKDVYCQYIRKTLWGEAGLMEDRRKLFQKMMDSAVIALPKAISIPLFGFIHNNIRIWAIERKIRQMRRMSNRCNLHVGGVWYDLIHTPFPLISIERETLILPTALERAVV